MKSEESKIPLPFITFEAFVEKTKNCNSILDYPKELQFHSFKYRKSRF